MLRMTGTTAVTAGLGAVVLLNGVLSWGTRRAEPQAEQDLSRPSAVALDPGAALRLRPAAWRPWPAPTEPAAPVSVAPPLPQPAALAAATQPDIPVAAPAEASPSLVGSAPMEHITRSDAPPSPQAEAADAPRTSTPMPSVGALEVSGPPLAKDRMSLAGPDAEPGPVILPHTGHDAPRTQSPPATEPPGNASATPVSGFGPDNLIRLERNGF